MKITDKTLIGVTGYANTGKDTLVNFMIDIYKNCGLIAKRYSFADHIKKELRDVIYNSVKIDPCSCSREDKGKIRELLVTYGVTLRDLTEGQYLIKKVEEEILKDIDSESVDVFIISDIRFCEYEDDEVSWLMKNGGVLFNVSRFDKDRWIGPANETENIQTEKIKEYVVSEGRIRQFLDLSWATMDTVDDQIYNKNVVENILKNNGLL